VENAWHGQVANMFLENYRKEMNQKSLTKTTAGGGTVTGKSRGEKKRGREKAEVPAGKKIETRGEKAVHWPEGDTKKQSRGDFFDVLTREEKGTISGFP